MSKNQRNTKKTRSKLKSKNGTKQKTISQMAKMSTIQHLPPNHRFDDEIASICSSSLLKAEFERIESNANKNKVILKFILDKINQRRISKVSTQFFAKIIEYSRKNNRVSLASFLEMALNEYILLKEKMNSFTTVSFLERFHSFIINTEKSGWIIHRIEKGFKDYIDLTFDHMIVDKNTSAFFNESGRLIQTLTVCLRTKSPIQTIINIGYECGILFQQDILTNNTYNLHIFPDNNIPGYSVMPTCIRQKTRPSKGSTNAN